MPTSINDTLYSVLAGSNVILGKDHKLSTFQHEITDVGSSKTIDSHGSCTFEAKADFNAEALKTLCATAPLKKQEQAIVLIQEKKPATPPMPECIMENEKKGAHYTTVKWNDGTYTTVKASSNDQNEKSAYIAFCAALAKKLYGTNSKVHRIVDRHMSTYLESEKKKAAYEKRKAEAERQQDIERKKIIAEAKRQRIKRMAKDYNAKYFAGPVA